jgi:hypothetical protein
LAQIISLHSPHLFLNYISPLIFHPLSSYLHHVLSPCFTFDSPHLVLEVARFFPKEKGKTVQEEKKRKRQKINILAGLTGPEAGQTCRPNYLHNFAHTQQVK